MTAHYYFSKARTEGAWLVVVVRFLGGGHHLLVWCVRLACLMFYGDADMSINCSDNFLFIYNRLN